MLRLLQTPRLSHKRPAGGFRKNLVRNACIGNCGTDNGASGTVRWMAHIPYAPKPHSRASISSGQRLEDVKWHLIRYDNLRISLASRGGLVLSADALIAAGATVLVGQRISQRGGIAMTTAVAIIGVLSLLCVGVSVTFAARAIANIRPWRSVIEDDASQSIFFDASDTAVTVKSLQDFEYLLHDVDEDTVLRYAIIDLWKCIRAYRSRYNRLRMSLRFLLIALWIFLSAVVLQFVALALHP